MPGERLHAATPLRSPPAHDARDDRADPRTEAQEKQPAFTVARWNDWFAAQEYGNDPYFYFSEEETGATGCPAETRLTLMRADSLKVRFDVDGDQLPGSEAESSCVVAFAQLRGRPTRDQLEPNRTMWRLQAQHVQ